MSNLFKEPELSILILDYLKPNESLMLLNSIKKHVKVPHKVIFCDNGSGEKYPYFFLEKGLIDQLIVNRESFGLGVGTRDLFAASHSKYSMYVQNDQYFYYDLTEEIFKYCKSLFGEINLSGSIGESVSRNKSISLAGYNCGFGVFSERAFLIETDFYKSLEPLSLGGAGPLHDLRWRENQIQEIYKKNNWFHYYPNFYECPIVLDNGAFAIRDMRFVGRGLWVHRTDNRQLWQICAPNNLDGDYPRFNDIEKDDVLKNGWEDGKVPEIEINEASTVWENNILVKNQEKYIQNLRESINRKC